MTGLLATIHKIAELESHRVNADVDLPANIRELTGYEPRFLQGELSRLMRRFNVLVMHRRFGKSVWAVNELIERAVECPFDDGRYAYLGPTYAQTEDIAWTYLQAFTEGFPGRKVEQSKLAVWIPTRRGSVARIRLYGVDSPKQRLRGLYLDGVVGDEFAQIPPSVWTEQVRPMLSDDVRAGVDDLGRPNQWAAFISTPWGRNFFHTLYQNAALWSKGLPVVEQKANLDQFDVGEEQRVFRTDWFAALYRASETGIIVEKELRDALHDMGQGKYDQEYECSWDAAVEGAIYARQLEGLRAAGRITAVPYNSNLPVDTGWDLGWDDATAIWFCQNYGGEPRLIDYYEASGAPLQHYRDVLERRGYVYGRHYLPHDVEVSELGTGKSRRQILGEMGVRVTTVPKHSPWDGIAAVQALLPRMWIAEDACVEGLDRLALYRRQFDERLGTFREKPRHDWASHGADALRTLVMGMRVGGPEADARPNASNTKTVEY